MSDTGETERCRTSTRATLVLAGHCHPDLPHRAPNALPPASKQETLAASRGYACIRAAFEAPPLTDNVPRDTKNRHRIEKRSLTQRVTGFKPCVMTTAQERKQQERQARRRRIQQAARTVFAERGYAKTSIEQVARQASLSVGAIYLYFRSKEDLYISLIEETLESFDAELGAMRTRPDLHPTSRLQAAWSHLTGWAVSDVEGTRILRLIAQPGVRKQLSDEVAAAAAAGIEKIRNHFAALVAAGVEAGRYRPVDAHETADLLWALFIGVLETSDARKNLGLEGASFTESSQAAFAAIEGGLRTMANTVAEAA